MVSGGCLTRTRKTLEAGTGPSSVSRHGKALGSVSLTHLLEREMMSFGCQKSRIPSLLECVCTSPRTEICLSSLYRPLCLVFQCGSSSCTCEAVARFSRKCGWEAPVEVFLMQETHYCFLLFLSSFERTNYFKLWQIIKAPGSSLKKPYCWSKAKIR